MSKGKVIILSGPSGSGKTTLYSKLLKSRKLKSKLVKSISVTTRPKRKGEVHGRDYLFVSPKMFQFKKRNGHFLEHQKVFDNYYGTLKKSVKSVLSDGKSVLLCIDVKGARVVYRKIPKAVRIFIKTPSLEVLKRRLSNRGSEKKKSLSLRLKTARQELKEAKYYDHVITNDNLQSCFAKLEAVILQYVSR